VWHGRQQTKYRSTLAQLGCHTRGAWAASPGAAKAYIRKSWALPYARRRSFMMNSRNWNRVLA